VKITDIKAFSVAIPFTAPIRSAMGVSYPARMRTLIQVHTDEGIVGWGECGYHPLRTFTGTPQAAAFEGPIKEMLVGESPYDTNVLRRKMNYSLEESVAVELACWDIMGKAAGVPVYKLLGGETTQTAVEHSAYCFFRAPDREGKNEVTLDNHAEHCLNLAREHGFRTLKLKLGVFDPDTEIEAVIRLCEAAEASELKGIRLVLDPNGAWTLATAMYVAKRLEPYNILYYEDPIQYDEINIRRLQQATSTPIAVSCYSMRELRSVLINGTAEVPQTDLYGSGGLRGTNYWYATVRAFQRPAAMHSGREIGIAQVAKMHVVAAQPDTVFPTDGIYNQYVDDILVGGKLVYQNGALPLSNKPGLGIEVDEAKLAQWELTDAVHREFDEFWADTKANLGIGALDANSKVRYY
jgi:glucarate dehydratase